MRIELELPEVVCLKKLKELRQQAKKWDHCMCAASVGMRFCRLQKLLELNAPTVVLDHSKRLLAEAIVRYDAMYEDFEKEVDAIEFPIEFPTMEETIDDMSEEEKLYYKDSIDAYKGLNNG